VQAVAGARTNPRRKQHQPDLPQRQGAPTGHADRDPSAQHYHADAKQVVAIAFVPKWIEVVR
jgi:hypothetical protein